MTTLAEKYSMRLNEYIKVYNLQYIDCFSGVSIIKYDDHVRWIEQVNQCYGDFIDSMTILNFPSVSRISNGSPVICWYKIPNKHDITIQQDSCIKGLNMVIQNNQQVIAADQSYVDDMLINQDKCIPIHAAIKVDEDVFWQVNGFQSAISSPQIRLKKCSLHDMLAAYPFAFCATGITIIS